MDILADNRIPKAEPSKIALGGGASRSHQSLDRPGDLFSAFGIDG